MALFPTKKITALAPAVTPLTGTEELECVQIGSSKKVTTRDFVLPTDSLVTLSGMGGSIPGSRQLISSPSVTLVDGGPGGTCYFETAGSSSIPVGVQGILPPAGTINNFALGVGVGFLEVDTANGTVSITGIQMAPVVDGTFLRISNVGPNTLNLLSMNAGSAVGTRFRFSDDMAFLQYGGITVRYSNALGFWIPV